MRKALGFAILLGLSLVLPADGATQQSVDVLPVGARVRVVVAELGGTPVPGQVAAAGDCVYVSAEFGRNATVGIPLNRILAAEIDAANLVVRADVDRSSAAWLPVDLDDVLQQRPQRCEGQPFTKIVPLRWGVLIQS